MKQKVLDTPPKYICPTNQELEFNWPGVGEGTGKKPQLLSTNNQASAAQSAPATDKPRTIMDITQRSHIALCLLDKSFFLRKRDQRQKAAEGSMTRSRRG